MIDIKFRAYQKNFKRIFDVVSIGFCKNGIEKIEIFNGENALPKYSTYRLDSKEFPLSDLELMKYTGVKDKNGKDIYSGYIVKHTCFSHNFFKEAKFKNYVIKEYNTNCFIGYRYVNGRNFFKFTKGSAYECKDEVIGNIYENPELLENEKAIEAFKRKPYQIGV